MLSHQGQFVLQLEHKHFVASKFALSLAGPFDQHTACQTSQDLRYWLEIRHVFNAPRLTLATYTWLPVWSLEQHTMPSALFLLLAAGQQV